MTTDLEKQFFDTFGLTYPCRFLYPEITDTHYLQLICLMTKELNCFTNYRVDYECLKKEILKEIIFEKDCFNKQEVLEIFEEV